MKLDFDERFQEHIVRLMFQDKEFGEAALSHLNHTAFENPVHAWTVKQMASSLQLNGYLPDKLILRQERRKAEAFGTIRQEDRGAYRRFIAKKLHLPVPNRAYLKKELHNFVTNQAWKAFILEAVDKHLPKKNFNDLKKRAGEVLDLDLTGDYSPGTRPGATFMKRVKERARASTEPGITTGIDKLDELMTNSGLMPKQLGCVIAPTGRGKSLRRGTKILMFDGTLRNVEDVRVGDELMGPDSKPRIAGGIHRGRAPMFRIEPVKGDPWVCNDVHVLTLVNTETDEVVDIPLDEYLKKSKWWKHCHKQFSVGVDFPKQEQPLPIDPYFLGLWFGDGTKTEVGQMLCSVEVTKPDKEVKLACAKVAAQWGLDLSTYSYDGEKRYRVVKVSGGRNPLLDTIRELTGPKTAVPRTYLGASKAERLEFLAGWLDADGHLHYGGYDFIQKRKDWAEAVVFLARSLGFKVTMKACQKRCQTGAVGTYYRVHISGDCSVIPLRIRRKKAKPRKQVKDACRTGFKVVPLGRGDYYGFTLDGDGRFLLGDFTVTHNTNFLVNLAAEAVLLGVPTLYITLELDENTINTRFDARFTGVSIRALKTQQQEVVRKWRKVRKSVRRNLVVKEFPMETTVSQIRNHIKRLERQAFYPKLLVIDYGDLLKASVTYTDNVHETQGQTYRDIIRLLKDLKMAGWTATQGNRASLDTKNKGDVDLSMGAGSVQKAYLADVVLGIAQTEKEKKFKQGSIVVLKNRNGAADRRLKVDIRHDVVTFKSIA